MALTKLKGQNFRVFLNGTDGDVQQAISEAMTCSVSITGNMEDETTKDSINDYTQEQMTSKSWQITAESVDASYTELLKYLFVQALDKPITVSFDATKPHQNLNRTAQNASFARSGQAYLTDLTIQATNRQTINISMQFTGTGPLS